MWEQVRVNFEQSAARVTAAIVRFLPELLAMFLILATTFLVAVLIRMILGRFLTTASFDSFLRRWALVSDGLPAGRFGRAASRIAFWVVMFLGFLFSLFVFQSAATDSLSMWLIALIPKLLVAAIIVAVGVGVSHFLERHILISAVNQHIHFARLLSLGVKWLTIVLAWAMALEHLGVAGGVVTLFFGILFGGIVLALALAVGLGARDLVKKSLARHLHQQENAPEADDIQHL